MLLIINPAAQQGQGALAGDVAFDMLKDRLGKDRVASVSSEQPGHASNLAAAAHEGNFNTIIALGGDGLAHEIANGLMRIPRNKRPVMGLIPTGSGNDFARTLGMAENVSKAVMQLSDAREQTIDLGCCNGEYFAETLSFGLDAAIALDTVERRQRTGQHGARLYLASGIDQLFHNLNAYRIKATFADSRTIWLLVHMFAVQNGPTYGGGFQICPDASPSDGLLDICYADAPMSVPMATLKFLSAKGAHHTLFKNIHFERTTAVELVFDTRPPCQIDGERMSASTFKISLARDALDVLMPS